MPFSIRRHVRPADLLARITALEARNKQLEHQNGRLRINKAFGCMTRQGLELVLEEIELKDHVCVYWDLDNMKWQNEHDPDRKPGVNVRIQAALHARAEDLITGQVFSGDEFCAWPLADDAMEMAQRLQTSFRNQNLPATFVIVGFGPDETPFQVLEHAGALCDDVKESGHRDSLTSFI